MTELEKIKEALARHTHSSAVMRLANPPFVEGVSKEQVEWLIEENDDKNVHNLNVQVADLREKLGKTQAALEEANHANESNLNTIQQFSDKIAALKMNHAHEVEQHKFVIASQYALMASLENRVKELNARSWWQHTKESFMAWFHAHVV